jgi:serine/threonine protein kinase
MRTLKEHISFPNVKLLSPSENKIGKYILAMEKLGPNLYEIFKLRNRKFSLKTVCMIMDSILDLANYLSMKGIVHRDIKPENFCLGGENLDRIYMIDFGLSRHFLGKEGQHKPLTNNRGFVGTPRYASKNAHLGISQSRRDDVESIGYLSLFFMTGKLPWQNIKVKDKVQKHNILHQYKNSMSIEKICEGLPYEFAQYLGYTRNLAYNQSPDYDRLRNFFKGMAKRHGLEFDHKWDWSETQKFKEIVVDYQKTREAAKVRKISSTVAVSHENLSSHFYIANKNMINRNDSLWSKVSNNIDYTNSKPDPTLDAMDSPSLGQLDSRDEKNPPLWNNAANTGSAHKKNANLREIPSNEWSESDSDGKGPGVFEEHVFKEDGFRKNPMVLDFNSFKISETDNEDARPAFEFKSTKNSRAQVQKIRD